jgi:hypothetical protein
MWRCYNQAVVLSSQCVTGPCRYVVGQYPKFLRAHWKFLKTVVNKLFEFMHETHPGVQVRLRGARIGLKLQLHTQEQPRLFLGKVLRQWQKTLPRTGCIYSSPAWL